MAEQTVKILAVCLGNICRSPTAEAAIRQAAEVAGIPVEVDSAGTGGWHVGAPPDARMRTTAAEMGLTLTGQARQVVASDFDDFDIIVAMDQQNQRDLVDLAPSPQAAGKIHLLRSFDPHSSHLDVPDPYYGGQEGFREVVTMVQAAANGLVASLVSPTNVSRPQ